MPIHTRLLTQKPIPSGDCETSILKAPRVHYTFPLALSPVPFVKSTRKTETTEREKIFVIACRPVKAVGGTAGGSKGSEGFIIAIGEDKWWRLSRNEAPRGGIHNTRKLMKITLQDEWPGRYCARAGVKARAKFDLWDSFYWDYEKLTFEITMNNKFAIRFSPSILQCVCRCGRAAFYL